MLPAGGLRNAGARPDRCETGSGRDTSYATIRANVGFYSLMHDLNHRLAANLDEAFPEFVSAMRDPLYSGMRRLQPHDAEDLTQEAFIRAYQALKTYDPDRIRALKLNGWIWTIALNLGRNHARNKARRPTPAPLLDRHGVTDPDPVDIHGWDRRLSGLSPVQRKTVILRFIVGLTNREISEVLDRPEGTVKADIHRGLQRLRKTMEEEQ